MLTNYQKALFLCFTIVCSVLTYAGSGHHTAGNITIELEGRGLYQEAVAAQYFGNKVILDAPQSGWLDDTGSDNLDRMKGINLNDLSKLASYLDEGIRQTRSPFEISIEFVSNGKKTTKQVLPVKNIQSKSGNMEYVLSGPVDLPEEMENVTVLVKTWPFPTPQAAERVTGGRGPTKAVCCDCSGWCAFVWVMFAYCKSCLSYMGGEYCCSECNMPAAPGGKCP